MATAATQEITKTEKIDPARWKEPVGGEGDLRTFLNAAAGAIRSAVPKHLTPERMMRVAMTAATRNPDLLNCNSASLIAAVVQASQLGLECDGILGQAYLVPFFNNKTKRKEAQLIPGYKGLLKLVRNSGELETIQDRCVYRGDEFSYSFGMEPSLHHIPTSQSTEITHAWAAATLKGGGRQFEVMTIGEINKIKERSKAKDFGPWVTDFEMMCRKTVTKRLTRLLPVSVELASAVTLDDRHEAGKSQIFDTTHLLPPEIRESLPDPDEGGDESQAEPVKAKGEGPAAELSEFTQEAYKRIEAAGFTRDQGNAASLKVFKNKTVAKLQSQSQITEVIAELEKGDLPA